MTTSHALRALLLLSTIAAVGGCAAGPAPGTDPDGGAPGIDANGNGIDANGNDGAPGDAGNAGNDQNPTVALTQPADGSAVLGSVVLRATSSDDHGVVSVEFFANGASLGSSTTAPYQVTWDTSALINGNYGLVARATDTTGHTADVSVQVFVANSSGADQPPSVRLIYPLHGSRVCGSITIEAATSDDVGVSQVEVFVDGQSLGVDQTSPYQKAWTTNGVSNGQHVLKAVTTDTANQKVQNTITVDVQNMTGGACDNLPTVVLTAPGYPYATSATIPITASASDDVGVVKVQFFVDNGLIVEDNTVPYTASWITSAFSDGPHTIKALAYDTTNQTTQDVRQIVLDRVSPSVAIVAPAATTTVTLPFNVTAGASDVNGIDHVSFTMDHSTIGSASVAPYTTTVSSATSGSHTLRASAFDKAGNSSGSYSVAIIVDLAPSASFSSPTPGAIVRGQVPASVNAADDFGIVQVEFFVGEASQGVDTTAPYAIAWDTHAVPNGSTSLKAVVTDTRGQQTTAQVTVTVSNPAPTLGLLAGKPGGAGHADGIGANARFGYSRSVAADGSGNIYLADGDTIRKIVRSTGVVTTLVATPAEVVAIDGSGNLYATDGCEVRRVVIATALVTTLAGTARCTFEGGIDGTGAAASFRNIGGIVADGAGNLYVADGAGDCDGYCGGTIRKIVIATGTVTTIAGSSTNSGSSDGTGAAAQFSYYLGGITTGAAGNVYVVDSGNNTIRRVVTSTGVVTTLAGNADAGDEDRSSDGTGAAARFNWPQGIASDGAGNLYVADMYNSTIRKIVASSGVVTTLAGTAHMEGSADGIGSVAQFHYPEGIASDAAGRLYVADTDNTMVRTIVISTRAVTTLAGLTDGSGSADGTGPAALFDGPHAIASDGTNLYVADRDNHTIRKVVISTGATTTLAGAAGIYGSTDGTGAAARFRSPQGITTDGVGNLYVADTGYHTIRKLVISTGVVTTLAGTAGAWGSANGTGAAARFYAPEGLALDGTGNLYVADKYNDTIRKVVVSTGVVTTLAGTAGTSGNADGTGAAARFNQPSALTVDGAGNLYVAEASIRKVVISTGVVTTLAGTAGVFGSSGGGQGITIDGAGNLYFTGGGNSTVWRISLAVGTINTPIGIAGQRTIELGPLPGKLNCPVGLVALPQGDIAIADPCENAVLIARNP